MTSRTDVLSVKWSGFLCFGFRAVYFDYERFPHLTRITFNASSEGLLYVQWRMIWAVATRLSLDGQLQTFDRESVVAVEVAEGPTTLLVQVSYITNAR